MAFLIRNTGFSVLDVIRFTVLATLNRRPFSGEATFADGKTYTWIRDQDISFVRWHGPTATAAHRFAAPKRATALATALAAWQPRSQAQAAAEAPLAKPRAARGGRLIRPAFERELQRGKINTAPYWVPNRSPKFTLAELTALHRWRERPP
jgi:hypothetical protein